MAQHISPARASSANETIAGRSRISATYYNVRGGLNIFVDVTVSDNNNKEQIGTETPETFFSGPLSGVCACLPQIYSALCPFLSASFTLPTQCTALSMLCSLYNETHSFAGVTQDGCGCGAFSDIFSSLFFLPHLLPPAVHTV